MRFDKADIAREEQEGTLFYTALHEIGHVLGIGTLWEVFGLLSGAETTDSVFTGLQATEEYNQIFGESATGVPVHNEGAPGSRDAHWLESLFLDELMTPDGGDKLSRITVASLKVMGYEVNLAAADPYTKPAGVSTLLAQPSNGSVNSPSRASYSYSRASIAQVSVPMEISLPLPPTATSVQPARRPALSAASTQIYEKAVDVALIAAYQRGNVEKSHDVLVRHETEDAGFSLVSASDQFFAQLGTSLSTSASPGRG
jgi:hypothetical protein